MKALLVVLTALFFSAASFAQAPLLNTIDVQGYSKMLVNPENYIAHLLIQEEEQKVGYTTIGKLSIDSVKMNLLTNLKKFGLDEKDLKILGTSSQQTSQYPFFFTNIAYELKLKNKDMAGRLVSELKFVGLKGLIIRRVFTKAQKDALTDSLYNEALNDAKRIAADLAKKANKTVGEVKSIELRTNSVNSFGIDMDTNIDNFNTFNYNRIEMDYRDKHAICHLRVIFELK
jgi:uncharacterized protein YggE